MDKPTYCLISVWERLEDDGPAGFPFLTCVSQIDGGNGTHMGHGVSRVRVLHGLHGRGFFRSFGTTDLQELPRDLCVEALGPTDGG